MIAFEQWLEATPVPVIGLMTFLAMIGAAFVGSIARRHREKVRARDGEDEDGGRDGHVVSAVLGLLALLLGFTFALAVDRFETRRALVLRSCSVSPSRSRSIGSRPGARLSSRKRTPSAPAISMSSCSKSRTARACRGSCAPIPKTAAFDSVRVTAFSNSLLQVVSQVVDLDAARKAARQARVPSVVFVVLLIYVVVTAGMLGYVQIASRSVVAAGFLFALMVMSLMLILDIDRPAGGGIRESQEPTITLRDTLRAQPPGTFDRWR